MNAVESMEAVDPGVLGDLLLRIRGSEGFANSPRLCRLLEYLVEHSLMGDGRALQEYAVGLDVFDRGPNFDPHRDTIVRVTARRLRGRLDEYYDGPGRDDPLQVYIPKGHYRIELRPAGHTRGSGPRQSRRYLRLLPVSALLVFLPFLLSGSFSDRPVSTEAAATVVVPSSAAESVRLAKFLLDRRGPGDLEQAMALFEAAATQDPSIVDAWVGLARCFLIDIAYKQEPDARERALTRSENVLELALALDPRHAEARLRMSMVAEARGDPDRARRHLEQAVQYGQEDAQVLHTLASLQHSNGDLEAAIRSQRRSLHLNPLSTPGRLKLAEYLFNAGRFEEALAEYRHALTLTRDGYGNARVMIVSALVQLGRVDEAELVLDEMTDAIRTDAARALIAHAQGRTDDFRRAVDRLTGRSELRAAVSLLGIYAATGQMDKALTQLRHVHALTAAAGQAWRMRTLRQFYFLRPLYDAPEWQQQFASLD